MIEKASDWQTEFAVLEEEQDLTNDAGLVEQAWVFLVGLIQILHSTVGRDMVGQVAYTLYDFVQGIFGREGWVQVTPIEGDASVLVGRNREVRATRVPLQCSC